MAGTSPGAYLAILAGTIPDPGVTGARAGEGYAIAPPGTPAPAPAVEMGFGAARLSGLLPPAPVVIPALQRMLLPFRPSPLMMVDEMAPPFAGWNPWPADRFVGRRFGDWIDLQLNLQVVSRNAFGSLTIDLETGSTLGPVVSDSAALLKPANEVERVTMAFTFQCRETVMMNGIQFFITSTVPVTMARETVVILPHSAIVKAKR